MSMVIVKLREALQVRRRDNEAQIAQRVAIPMAAHVGKMRDAMRLRTCLGKLPQKPPARSRLDPIQPEADMSSPLCQFVKRPARHSVL
jgi:hypothetical protein